ncbi:hypothetical protein CR513_33817, partial [Mucuna pruriens]
MPWYADIYNFLMASMYPQRASKAYKNKLGSEAKDLLRGINCVLSMTCICGEYAMIKCISESEIQSVLHFCHVVAEGGHYGSGQTAWKVFDCWLYWPTIFRDTHEFVSACE